MRSREIEQYKESLRLSKLQRETLIGLLLGDAHLETQNGGGTYRLEVEYGIRQNLYVDHLYDLFREWVLTRPRHKRDDSHNNLWFQTVSHRAFRFYAHQFYVERKKRVPRLIHRFLTPRGLAYWFMDDASLKSRESKGVLFNTQGFLKADVERLTDLLVRRFDIKATLRAQREGWQVYVSGKSFERFRELVEPFVLSSMRYKLPAARITQMPKK
ncbi:MAG: LAGLIDADG endonuclease [Candidatus Eisenbacteria bacterium]|nr:LAGLIDADG endonuclease [Candidatus Eisenbacteria bacterium]